jgi:hypothetical protein
MPFTRNLALKVLDLETEAEETAAATDDVDEDGDEFVAVSEKIG